MFESIVESHTADIYELQLRNLPLSPLICKNDVVGAPLLGITDRFAHLQFSSWHDQGGNEHEETYSHICTIAD